MKHGYRSGGSETSCITSGRLAMPLRRCGVDSSGSWGEVSEGQCVVRVRGEGSVLSWGSVAEVVRDK